MSSYSDPRTFNEIKHFIEYKAGGRYVTLVFRSNDRVLKASFHCNNCKNKLFEYYDELQSVVEMQIPNAHRPREHMCQRCKIIYCVVII